MATMTERKRKPNNVIGYCMSEKKRQKINWTEFSSVCRKNGYDLVKLDLNRSLEDQGPFSVILHKLTVVITAADKGDSKSQEMLHRVESYLQNHPEVAVIDPLENVRNLLDRYKSYSIIHKSGLEDDDVFIPAFAELTSDDVNENINKLKAAGIKFPFVCKPSEAHGSSKSHKMCIIFNEQGVKNCKPPCVAQTFVNHNAILYKIYLVGEEFSIVERPSLKNFYPCDRETIFFDSHDVSKPDSKSALNILEPHEKHMKTPTPDLKKFKTIAATLRKEFGMSLIGVDIVIENGSEHYTIIDINVYPGYDGFPDFFEALMRCIKQVVRCHTESLAIKKPVTLKLSSQIFRKPGCSSGNLEQDDSGFDTGDSSDEKKRDSLRSGYNRIISLKK